MRNLIKWQVFEAAFLNFLKVGIFINICNAYSLFCIFEHKLSNSDFRVVAS